MVRILSEYLDILNIHAALDRSQNASSVAAATEEQSAVTQDISRNMVAVQDLLNAR